MSPALVRRAIIVCAMGYFIDVFDIQLFPVLRVASLTGLGIAPDRIAAVGGNILNVQMAGMILGAFLWGWLGDRVGRLKALYGSILIYSLGTLACSFVHDVFIYGALRCITGFGLAGETGAAITLIAELMPRGKRGWGIIFISGFGFLGPATAVLISWIMDWRSTYIVAGCLGLLLFALRLGLAEPALFQRIGETQTTRGTLRLLKLPRQSLLLFFCMLIGFPFAYLWNLLNFFEPEISQALLVPGMMSNQKICLLLFYTGTSLGDVLCGSLSQIWQSRRRATFAILVFGAAVSGFYLLVGVTLKFTLPVFYVTYFLLGIAGGGWLLFCMIAVEHFGTNVRATTSLLVVNAVRGFAIPMIMSFGLLKESLTSAYAAALIGAIIYAVAFLALRGLRETHNLDLDYVT